MKRCLLGVLLGLLVTAVTAQGGVFDWEKAVSLYKQGQFQAAIVEFQRVVAEFPNHADSWKFIGLAYYQLQQYDQALPALQKAIELKQSEGKSDPDLLLALSRAKISLKQYDQALPQLETLVRQRPDLAANHYMLGVAYANLNRSEDAIASFRTAAKLQPTDADTWQYLSIQLLRLERLTEAITTLRQGLTAAPKNAEMLALITETLLRQGGSEANAPKSAALYEEAVRFATTLRTVRDDAVSADLLGRANLAAKKYGPAEQSLLRAVALTKQPSAVIYFNLGLAQAQQKAWARAIESFTQADRLKPNDVNTLYYVGYVYENLRRYPQSLEAYTRAYEASGRSNQDLKASIDRVAPFAKSQ
jgi:tetratricopeptide (TPR) repeat protein